MPDPTREVLRELLQDHAPEEEETHGVTCECGLDFIVGMDYMVHLAEIIASACLVVPRSDITGAEAGRPSQRPPLGYVVVTQVEGRGPFVHGDHRLVMASESEAIASAGRSDRPRGMRHVVTEAREARR